MMLDSYCRILMYGGIEELGFVISVFKYWDSD